VLCPSFYRAELVRNPNAWDRLLHKIRRAFIGWLGGRAEAVT
jgi:indolepyruvate ferredoxin oxidoreductase alpha subunit